MKRHLIMKAGRNEISFDWDQEQWSGPLPHPPGMIIVEGELEQMEYFPTALHRYAEVLRRKFDMRIVRIIPVESDPEVIY